MNRIKIIALLAIAAIATNCSSNSSGSGTAVDIRTVSGALKNVASKVSATIPNTSGVSTTSLNTRAAMDEWTTGLSQYSIGGMFGDTPRNYVRQQGDDTVQGSLMYRLDQVMESLCIFATAIPSTNGVPNLSAATTLTLTSALIATIESTCSADLSNDMVDATVGYQVEDISGLAGSDYDRKISFDMNGGSTFHNYFYFTLSSTLTRMAFVEDSTNDSVAFFEYSATDGLFKFEYSEIAVAPFRVHYRGMLSEGTNLGRFVAWSDMNDDSAITVVSVEEGVGDELHASYTFVDDGANDFTDGSACISTSTFSISTDNVQTCGNITGVLASAFTADPNTEIGANNTYVLGRDHTSLIQFNSLTNILTSGLAN